VFLAFWELESYSSSQTDRPINTQYWGSLQPITVWKGASLSSRTFFDQFNLTFNAKSKFVWCFKFIILMLAVSSILALIWNCKLLKAPRDSESRNVTTFRHQQASHLSEISIIYCTSYLTCAPRRRVSSRLNSRITSLIGLLRVRLPDRVSSLHTIILCFMALARLRFSKRILTWRSTERSCLFSSLGRIGSTGVRVCVLPIEFLSDVQRRGCVSWYLSHESVVLTLRLIRNQESGLSWGMSSVLSDTLPGLTTSTRSLLNYLFL